MMKGSVIKELNQVDVDSLILQSNQADHSAQSELSKLIVQTIHCQKCKHENEPSAKKCSQCSTNLLPGTGIQQRLGALVSALVVAAISFVAAFLLLKYKPEFGEKDWIYFAGLALFGAIMLIFGIIWFLRITPLYERYATRAKRHIELNPWQAIADYGSAIDNAPKTQAFDYLLERAKLHQGLDMTMESRADWKQALENINTRIVQPRASIDLIKQRAEIYKYLGMEDEYAMQMLQYTIDKEKTFKTKSGQIAEGWEEGLQKGSEDAQRQELQKLRAAIMINQKYKIVGQCKKCRSIVDLDARLECTNNSKHHITNINPTLREID
jgi:ribosomal protein L40E